MSVAPFVADPDCEMPADVQERNYLLNRAAIRCYTLRNAATDTTRAQDYEEMGDRFLSRAIALTEEWS